MILTITIILSIASIAMSVCMIREMRKTDRWNRMR